MVLQGIYRITNNIDGKFYIGSSDNIFKRWKEHTSLLYNNAHHNYKLQLAFNEYGIKNFKFEILEIIKDHNKLLSIEQQYIQNTKCYYDEIGYNIRSSTKKIIKINKENKFYKNKKIITPYEKSQLYKNLDTYKKEILKNNLKIIGIEIFNKSTFYKLVKDETSFCQSWLCKTKNSEFTKKMLLNYIKNILSKKFNIHKGKYIYWTTYVKSQKYLQGKGFIKSFIPFDAIPKEKRNYLVFSMNLYFNSFVNHSLNEKVNDDEFALSSLIKWIINVTDINKPIILFIPSLRMKKLLNDWLETIQIKEGK